MDRSGSIGRHVCRVHAFVASWIARYGIPETVTSDRGSQFTSDTWKLTLSKLGISASFTTAFHSQANRMIERYHRSLKNALRCTSSGDWLNALPWVLLGLRTAPREDMGVFSAEVLFGTPLRIPGTCFDTETPTISAEEQLKAARANVNKFTPKSFNQTKFREKVFIPADLNSAESVFVRDDNVGKGPLAPRYKGPFKVVKKNWDKGIFKLEKTAKNY